MELSNELFSEITGQPGSPPVGETGGTERRTAGRVGLAIKTPVMTFRGGILGPATMVSTCDISIKGVGFVHDQAMHYGEQLLIRLPRQKDKPVWIRCTVTRWQPLGENRYAIGAEFQQVIDLKSMALHASAGPGVGVDLVELEKRIRQAVLS